MELLSGETELDESEKTQFDSENIVSFIESMRSTLEPKILQGFKTFLKILLILNIFFSVLMLTILNNFTFSVRGLTFSQPSILILCLTVYFLIIVFAIRLFSYKNKDPLKIFEAYFQFNSLIVVFAFFTLIAIFLLNNNLIEFSKQLVGFFDISPSISDSISRIIIQRDLNNLFDVSKIVALISIIVIYCSIFSHLRNKGLYALNGSSNEARYLFFIYNSLLPIFTNFLIPITILYYIFILPDPIQILLLIDIFLFVRMAVIPLMYSCFNVIMDYPSLEKLNVPTSATPIYSISRVLNNVPLLQSGIFFISIFTILLTIQSGFNILSIVYIVLCIFVWFHIMSLLSSIPRDKMAFKLMGGFVERDCYITEETNFGDYVILTSDPNPIKKTKKIFRASLVSVEVEEKTHEPPKS